jgi:poly(A) polymerase
VRFGSLEEDVKRRDFTCNGLYLEVTPARLIDLVGGRADLAARLLRAIGDPEARLAEDHLRLLRAARFACQLACELDASLLAAMTRCAPLLRQVSSERVGSELGRMLCGRDPGRGIRLLWATGALAALWPGCQFERDAWERAARMLDRLVHGELESALVCLLLAEPPAHHAAMLERLRLSRDQQRRIQALLAGIATLEAGPSLVARKRLLREPFAPALLEVYRARALASDGRLDLVIEWQCELHGWLREACLWPQPLLDGRALVALGFPAGPRLGALLRELEDAQLSGAITTLEQAHAWLARMRP